MRNREDKKFYEGSIHLHALAGGLSRIYKTVQKEGLTEENTLALAGDVKTVADHFGICPKGAVLMGYITEHNVLNGSDLDDLAAYVGCSNIEFYGFRDAIEELEARGVVVRAGSRGRRPVLVLTREAAKSIADGSPFEPVPMTGLDIDDLFTRFRMFFSDYARDAVDSERLLESIRTVVEANQQLAFCRKAVDCGLLKDCPDTQQRMFFYLCHRLVSYGNEAVPLMKMLEFGEFMEDGMRLRRNLAQEKTWIQTAGLVTFAGEGGFKDGNALSLTEEAVKGFLSEVDIVRGGDEDRPDVVKAESIAPKELFYNEREAAQMARLEELLKEDNFRDVQQRLGEMGMRKGFAVLFSGGAGTGKTAGVYELARRTGRDVFAVDMSQLKSKWVGDSEKIVKGVFSTYADMCRGRDRAPILLFNEADAIFSKRIEDPERSVDQMMNAIQNICLEAMENLDGILIATTNLPGNFCDDAFARRFIIKVAFDTPEPEVRAKIWRSMIPGLPQEDAELLGSKYGFAGGSIENVARKVAVEYVISGTKATLDDLVRYANEEALPGTAKSKRIGFQA